MCSIRFTVSIDEKTGKLVHQVSESPVGQITGKSHGDYYVYEWFLVESGDVFYVGKGRGNRYKEYHDHAYEAERIRSMYRTDVRFVGVNLSEEEAVELETQEMYRILNETPYILTNRMTPLLARRRNGYSPSENTPPLRFETAPIIYVAQIDERYFGMQARTFDTIDIDCLSKVHFVNRVLHWDEEKILYGGNYKPYYDEVCQWLTENGCRMVKTKFAKSVTAWVYISDEEVHNYMNDQRLALERIGRNVPVYHLLDIWNMIKQQNSSL